MIDCDRTASGRFKAEINPYEADIIFP